MMKNRGLGTTRRNMLGKEVFVAFDKDLKPD